MIIKTTGIGSVPFDNIIDAMSFVKKCTIPYLPELKQENMLTLLENPLYFEQENWQTFVREAQNFNLVKVQLPGPLTYKFIKKELIYYTRKLQHAFERIKNDLKNIPFMLIIDEPCLLKTNERSILTETLNLLNYSEIGIHCCDHFKIADVNNLPIKFLSLDVSLFSDQDLIDLHRKFSLIIGANKISLPRIYALDLPNILISPPCGLKNITQVDIAEIIISSS
jgi:methionine synthase II (cobalamin-independent)